MNRRGFLRSLMCATAGVALFGAQALVPIPKRQDEPVLGYIEGFRFIETKLIQDDAWVLLTRPTSMAELRSIYP